MAIEIDLNTISALVKGVELNSKVHHLGIVVPKIVSAEMMERACEYTVFFEFQSLYMSYFYLDGVIIELLKPKTIDSPLRKYINSTKYVVDHLCYYGLENDDQGIKVTEKFYSPLWGKKCQFFLSKDLNKYEIIYEN